MPDQITRSSTRSLFVSTTPSKNLISNRTSKKSKNGLRFEQKVSFAYSHFTTESFATTGNSSIFCAKNESTFETSLYFIIPSTTSATLLVHSVSKIHFSSKNSKISWYFKDSIQSKKLTSRPFFDREIAQALAVLQVAVILLWFCIKIELYGAIAN